MTITESSREHPVNITGTWEYEGNETLSLVTFYAEVNYIVISILRVSSV